MERMRERSLWTYVACVAAMALLVSVIVLRVDKLALHAAINAHHAPWADAFFPYWTLLATGWAPTVAAIALLWRSWRCFLMVGLSAGLSALAVQALKHFAFSGHDRPVEFIAAMPGLHLVGGEVMNHHFSFPSGHATAAFSMCLALAVVIGRRGPAVLLALFAASLGFSRIYLSQHFTEDVLAGAIVGTCMSIVVYRMVYKGRWGHHPALDRSPFRARR
ncbi:MAG: phosphatase PAP2 family protein [Flavobacteriales bacterium]